MIILCFIIAKESSFQYQLIWRTNRLSDKQKKTYFKEEFIIYSLLAHQFRLLMSFANSLDETRSEKSPGLIYAQTVWYADGITERI